MELCASILTDFVTKYLQSILDPFFYSLTFRSVTKTPQCFSYNLINLPVEFLSSRVVSELTCALEASAPSKTSAVSLASDDHPCMLRCSFSWSLQENLLSHTGQVNVFSLVWIKRCLFSVFRKLKHLPHCEHL